MTNAELQQIKDDLAVITPGPWSVSENIVQSWGEMSIDVLDSDRESADLRFIASAPTRIAALVAEVERLQEYEWMYKDLQK